jgi:membrane associated rhomboid family serine protease
MSDKEERPSSDEHSAGGVARNPHDGLIDFRHYSLAQLRELQFGVDRNASPRDHHNLLAELKSREAQPSDAADWVTGRFSAADGLRGWLQAKRRGAPLYGAGALAVRVDSLLVRGWQRTWLGIPEDTELQLPFDQIRNVACDGCSVRWQYRHLLSWRGLEFEAQSAAAAASLAARLPPAQSAHFQQLEMFNRRLQGISEGTWVTRALVVANLAVFLLMAVVARSLGTFDIERLIAFGANGPLTIGGQWWRLLAALFVHANLLHVLLNMWALWNSGRMTERLFGRWYFAFIYMGSGLCASLASLVWDPTRVSVGASGAVFGVLGAFLACLTLRRNEMPVTVLRAHWLSTSIFVLFNLVTGALQSGIDNAAHLGGLVTGFVFGCLLIRPLDAEARLPVARTRWNAAFAALVAIVALALLQLSGRGSELTAPEQYMRAHSWYLHDEAANLRSWQELATRASAGTISDSDLGEAFAQQIVPFWQAAQHRLEAEEPSTPNNQRAFAALVRDFVRARLEWASAIAKLGRSGDRNDLPAVLQLAQQTDSVQARIERVELRSAMDHRARAAINSRWLAVLHRFWGTEHPCVHGPPAYGPQSQPGDASDDGPALRTAAGCRAQKLFLAGDYATLDDRFTQAAASIADLPDGGSTLQGVYGGLSDLFEFGALTPEDVLQRMAEWRRVASSPQWADTMETDYLYGWAWAARGHGYAAQVSQQAMVLFAHRTAMAAAGLDDLRQQKLQSPLWSGLALAIGRDRSIGNDALHSIFVEGVHRWPQYFSLYRGMLRALMPRWGGSYQQVDEFIRESSMRPGTRPDSALYARLYWMYGDLEGDSTNVFTDTQADWTVMQGGFQNLMRLHGKSDVILNAFARFACEANDGSKYGELRLLIEQRRSASAWTEKRTIESCDAALHATPPAPR